MINRKEIQERDTIESENIFTITDYKYTEILRKTQNVSILDNSA